MTEERASTGDKVRVHYTGRLAEGEVFDTSRNREPLEFTIGGGQLIPGFEEAAVGMQPGEEKTVEIAAGEAYGDRRDDLVIPLEKDRLPEELDPSVGDRLQLREKSGQPVDVTVTEVTEEKVIVDANHPLAGRDLTFDIELIEIV